MAKKFFITGIDTDIGKTICTAILGKYLLSCGHNVITHKLVQTGCEGISEDIIAHRTLMGMDILDDDSTSKTCGYVFKKPCSPHLAAELEGAHLEPTHLKEQIDYLDEKYEYLLIEGAGGPMVPLNRDLLSIDFAIDSKLPVILVSNGRLGSINHTLCCLEILKNRGADLVSVFYNRYLETDEQIAEDTRSIIATSMNRDFPKASLIDIHSINDDFKYDFKSITDAL